MNSTGGQRAVRIAVDLLGGDRAPGAVVEGVLAALEERPDVHVTLVGPPDVVADLLRGRGDPHRLGVEAATQVVEMAEDPARAVRRKRDATVRVATRLLRDGAVDAVVSMGSTGATMAAALFTLGRLPGVTRPALAVVVPGVEGRTVLLDVGANANATPDLLAQFALAGVAYARVRLGLAEPTVGLLSLGSEPGKGDALRREAYPLLADLPLTFAGNVEGGAVVRGGVVDVVVADGFTGNVLLKALEETRAVAGDPHEPADAGGAVLLGVDGVVVVGHGAAGPSGVACCVAVAADAVTEGLVGRTAAALDGLVQRRRTAAGLAPSARPEDGP